MRRMLSNSEVLDRAGDTVTVGSNFVLYEYRYTMTICAGRVLHTLALGGDRIRMRRKIVHLVNGDAPVSNLAFLI